MDGEEMLHHNDGNHKSKWECTQCEKKFTTKQGGVAHFKYKHRVKTFSCETSRGTHVITWDLSVSDMNDVFMCTCRTIFDCGKYRPRSLPCGHVFCTLCIESCIAQGKHSCPECTVCYGANSANEFPVSFLLEELIDEAAISTSQKYETNKNALQKVRFEILKDKKEAQMLVIQNQIKAFMAIEKDSKAIIQNKTDEQYNQEIMKKNKQHEQIQDALIMCQERKGRMRDILYMLRYPTTNPRKSEEDYLPDLIDIATQGIEESRKLEETLKKILNFNVDAPSKTFVNSSELHSNDIVMLDPLTPTVDSDDEREVVTVDNNEDAPSKTSIIDSEIISGTLVMLASLTPTVDSDDERENMKNKIAEDRVSSFQSYVGPIINHKEKPWSCALCPKSFQTEKGARHHILNSHTIKNCSYEQIIAYCLRKRDQIGQYIKGIFDCYKCNNTYYGGQNKPRFLPCGHGFCTQCIASTIISENKSCPVCRVCHGGNSANRLPVNSLLGELLEMATKSTTQEHGSDIIPEQMIVNLIKDMKDALMLPVYIQLERITYIENKLQALHKEKIDDLNNEIYERHNLEKEVEILLNKIEISNQEILRKQKPEQLLKDTKLSCRKQKIALESLKGTLKATSRNHIITQMECHRAASEVTKSQKWEKALLNINVHDKYASVKRNGILLCSKVTSKGGTAAVPVTTKDDKPTMSSILIKEEILNFTSATTTNVFLDFSAKGCYLGRVYARVLSNRAYGKLFVLLALGINGSTLKGAHFAYKRYNRIQLMDCVTENNSNSTELLNLLLPMEYVHYDRVSRGSLYRFTQGSFQILTKSDSENQKGYGYFGDVIAGLEVIDRAASDEFAITDITISESGIVLGY